MDAYERGRRAGMDDLGWLECPYSPTHHTSEYKSWMRGHADGMRDKKIVDQEIGPLMKRMLGSSRGVS